MERTDLEIIIYTIDGRVIHRKKLNNISGNGKVNLNLKNIAPGVYFYQVIKERNNKTEKNKIEKLVILR
jgi:hypothetical protein